MNTSIALVEELTRHGVRLALYDGHIVAMPKGKTPPDLVEKVRQHKTELLAYLRQQQEDSHADRLARDDGWRALPKLGSPAYSILQKCRDHGVALRIEPDGDLVVGKAGAKAHEPSQPWPELLTEIEAHLEPVARLVEAGWTLKAGFPKQAAA
jgi:hypothetical protein